MARLDISSICTSSSTIKKINKFNHKISQKHFLYTLFVIGEFMGMLHGKYQIVVIWYIKIMGKDTKGNMQKFLVSFNRKENVKNN
jgi:hypothetical protein